MVVSSYCPSSTKSPVNGSAPSATSGWSLRQVGVFLSVAVVVLVGCSDEPTLTDPVPVDPGAAPSHAAALASESDRLAIGDSDSGQTYEFRGFLPLDLAEKCAREPTLDQCSPLNRELKGVDGFVVLSEPQAGGWWPLPPEMVWACDTFSDVLECKPCDIECQSADRPDLVARSETYAILVKVCDPPPTTASRAATWPFCAKP